MFEVMGKFKEFDSSTDGILDSVKIHKISLPRRKFLDPMWFQEQWYCFNFKLLKD